MDVSCVESDGLGAYASSTELGVTWMGTSVSSIVVVYEVSDLTLFYSVVCHCVGAAVASVCLELVPVGV